MRFAKTRPCRPLVLSVVVWTGLVLALSLVGGAAKSQAAPALQIQCEWMSQGSAGTEHIHAASALDTDRSHLYVYGGLDASFATLNTVKRLDYPGGSGIGSFQGLRPGAVLHRFGAAGAYRARGAEAEDSALYFIGGLADIKQGQAETDIQRYATKAGTWTTLQQTVGARAFASATYDPEHDVIWVIGGVGQCSLQDVRLAGRDCQARDLATQYLSWDETTGELQVHTLAGGGVSRFAHSAVYDAVNKRILIYGGTDDIHRGSGNLVALDLSDPDPAKARFQTVATTGIAPQVYFHGAGMNTSRHWMIVSGGLSQGFLSSNESIHDKTYALHLASPGLTWTELGASPQERVAGVMASQSGGVIYTLGRTKYTGNATRPQNGLLNVHGLACQALRATPTPMPMPTSGNPSPRPATATPPPVITPLPDEPIVRYEPYPRFEVCPQVQGRVPEAIVQRALANVPSEVRRCNPNVPIGPDNLFRDKLGLQDVNKPYHPIFNGLRWKCGCP